MVSHAVRQWEVPVAGPKKRVPRGIEKPYEKKLGKKGRAAKQGHCEEVEGRLRPGVGEALGDPNF